MPTQKATQDPTRDSGPATTGTSPVLTGMSGPFCRRVVVELMAGTLPLRGR